MTSTTAVPPAEHVRDSVVAVATDLVKTYAVPILEAAKAE